MVLVLFANTTAVELTIAFTVVLPSNNVVLFAENELAESPILITLLFIVMTDPT